MGPQKSLRERRESLRSSKGVPRKWKEPWKREVQRREGVPEEGVHSWKREFQCGGREGVEEVPGGNLVGPTEAALGLSQADPSRAGGASVPMPNGVEVSRSPGRSSPPEARCQPHAARPRSPRPPSPAWGH